MKGNQEPMLYTTNAAVAWPNDDWLRGPLCLLRRGAEGPPLDTLCRMRQYVCLQRLR